MGQIRPPTRDHVLVIEDSRRWAGFEHRPDDIFISTPPKSGTTWTQGILASILWPRGDPPGERRGRSPWIDARFFPAGDVLADVAAQTHRRFIKTHSPADCVPIFEECKYVTVYRDARDAVMSWANHRANMRPEVIEHLNATGAEEGIAPIATRWDGDMDVLIDEWSTDQSPIVHLASWWPIRNEPFVCFVHYNDLKADLDGEMRRIAEFLEIDVPDQLWPDVIDRCGLEQMRDAARGDDGLAFIFEGGADSFFHKGTNGRWREALTPTQIQRVERLVADGLPGDAAEWLEHGSLALGRRP